jgi:hypothetical protein
LDQIHIPGLEILHDTLYLTEKCTWAVKTKCHICKEERWKNVANLYRGLSTKCQCQRPDTWLARYPGKDAKVLKSLAARYQAMRQRCEKDTHVSSHRYKGRGIKCLFKDRYEFVDWALKEWPEEDFRKKDFDRRDNDGHYCPGNLRLVTRVVNLLNKRLTQAINIGTARDFLKKHPSVKYTEDTVLGLLRSGLKTREILQRNKESTHAGRRKNGWC